jgi:hypothetical protein
LPQAPAGAMISVISVHKNKEETECVDVVC